MKNRFIALSVLALSLLVPGRALAEAGFTPEPFINKKLKFDGVPREWPGKNLILSETLRGDAKGRTVTAKLGYDSYYLYVTVDAEDRDLVRTARGTAGEDHATLHLAFPLKNGSYKTHTVDFYPGKPGKLPGLVKSVGRPVEDSKLVEAPHDEGFTFEAQVPWEFFPEAKRTRVGLRAALTYTDASGVSQVRSVVGTSRASSGPTLPPLPLESEQALLDALVRQQGLNPNPSRAAYGNLTAGPMHEQVALFGSFLSIVGPEYRAGKEFYFSNLGLGRNGKLTRLELVDFDGDGFSEILMVRRLGSAKKYRDVLQVFAMGKDDTPLLKFEHEVSIVTEALELRNDVQVLKAKRGAELRISQGRAKNVEADTWGEVPMTELSALLPWDSVKSRRYSLVGGKFTEAASEAWRPTARAPAKTTQPAPAGERKGSVSAPPPMAVRAPSADEMLDRVYALYRNDRKVGRRKPRFDFMTNVAEDSTLERVVLHGTDLVVFGKGFLEGQSYAYITVGVASPTDIDSVAAHDVTGDGTSEIVVRARLQAKASKALGGDVVTREAIFVYKVVGRRLERLFAAEVARSLGEDRVEQNLRFARSGKRGMIVLSRGKAKGWTEKTYPFPEDQGPAGGLEPLILPWSTTSSRQYLYDGERFSQK